MYLCELSIYEFVDGEADLQQMILRDSYERCLNLLHKVKGSLKQNEYFEIYCDETLENFYFLNDGTQIKTFKELESIVNA